MAKLVHEYEIVDHGIEHSQYFRGCGTAFTRYTDVATGIGDSAQEAFEDALEMLASSGWETDNIEMPDNTGEETVSALREEEEDQWARDNAYMRCGHCGEKELDCECEEPELEPEYPDTDEYPRDEDERYYHVSVRVREETEEETAYRMLREHACDLLRLPSDIEDDILADAMEDHNYVFSMDEVGIIRDGV